MQHEILFKATALDSKEWVEGFVIGLLDPTKLEPVCHRWIIHSGASISAGVEVVPETICQYINRNDKNGEKIFHKDRMKGTFWNKSTYKAKKKELEFTVEFDPKIGFFIDCTDYGDFRFFPHLEECTILGNIHDHHTTSN